jgi:protocatechuate 3,4-dioxygenase beta subunit
MMRAQRDRGLQLAVAGAVYNTRGEVLPGARIDVWKTNHEGRYGNGSKTVENDGGPSQDRTNDLFHAI